MSNSVQPTMNGDTAHLVVQNCLICPRRVGGYDLEGFTACPVGGLVRGATTTITGKTPQPDKIGLKTGEICNVNFNTSLAKWHMIRSPLLGFTLLTAPHGK